MSKSLPVAVMIPGWSMPTTAFEPLRAALGCVESRVLSLPGYEAPVADPTLWQAPEALENALLEQIPDRPVVLVGWSLGGILALMLAARAPQRVAGVMLLTCNPCFVARDNWPGMAVETFDQFTHGVAESPALTLRRFQQLCCQGSPEARRQARWLREEVAFTGSQQVLLSSLALLGDDYRGLMDRVSQPLLALLAQEDGLVPVALAEQLGCEVSVIEDSGHLLLADQADTVAEHLKSLLERCACGAEGGDYGAA
ncbi:alpha/beta fold hydrolase [Aestuariirhabdus litorea]|uniref:alpha/beta fold hydrolase n=1 Tax=Aestuariirhabdus litorea TaxID=2528527 RepID=UPI000F62874E|nr:alpha/beta fold hydrolase [Aestuariirhabdus litorea]RWW93324.1 alpha/beta fold hydrolase [Endozoicomonadaceae bacterium GTF-13]